MYRKNSYGRRKGEDSSMLAGFLAVLFVAGVAFFLHAMVLCGFTKLTTNVDQPISGWPPLIIGLIGVWVGWGFVFLGPVGRSFRRLRNNIQNAISIATERDPRTKGRGVLARYLLADLIVWGAATALVL